MSRRREQILCGFSARVDSRFDARCSQLMQALSDGGTYCGCLSDWGGTRAAPVFWDGNGPIRIFPTSYRSVTDQFADQLQTSLQISFYRPGTDQTQTRNRSDTWYVVRACLQVVRPLRKRNTCQHCPNWSCSVTSDRKESYVFIPGYPPRTL